MNVDGAGEAAQVQVEQVDEEEFFWQGEVFLDQPVTDKRAGVVIEDPLIRGEADGLQGIGPQYQRISGGFAFDRADHDALHAVEQQLVEAVH
ncbi:hypothetical protein D3C85_1293530 [compost metagenome]